MYITVKTATQKCPGYQPASEGRCAGLNGQKEYTLEFR